MFERILLPTDGSPGSAVAIEKATALATAFDAELHAVYVVDTSIPVDVAVPDVFGTLESYGESALDEVVTAADEAGVESVSCSVGRGPPHRVLLDYVDEHDVDLVVMGTHGRTGLDRYLVGSVTEKVVRLADVPVLTVPLPEAGDEE
jgi:nucleotide-binding universal stress UspA family protein